MVTSLSLNEVVVHARSLYRPRVLDYIESIDENEVLATRLEAKKKTWLESSRRKRVAIYM